MCIQKQGTHADEGRSTASSKIPDAQLQQDAGLVRVCGHTIFDFSRQASWSEKSFLADAFGSLTHGQGTHCRLYGRKLAWLLGRRG